LYPSATIGHVRAMAWEMYLTPFRFSLFMTLGMAGAVNAGSSDDLCLPAVGRDVCGVPIVALLSRYDQLYGKKLSTYAYIYYDMGGDAVISYDRDSPLRSDQYSCVRISMSDSTYSGAYKREEMKPGTYFARVTGTLQDQRESGACIGYLSESDINVIWHLDEP